MSSVTVYQPTEYRPDDVAYCRLCFHGLGIATVSIDIDGATMPTLCLNCFKLLRKVLTEAPVHE